LIKWKEITVKPKTKKARYELAANFFKDFQKEVEGSKSKTVRILIKEVSGINIEKEIINDYKTKIVVQKKRGQKRLD
jgi:hypothetical protein